MSTDGLGHLSLLSTLHGPKACASRLEGCVSAHLEQDVPALDPQPARLGRRPHVLLLALRRLEPPAEVVVPVAQA